VILYFCEVDVTLQQILFSLNVWDESSLVGTAIFFIVLGLKTIFPKKIIGHVYSLYLYHCSYHSLNAIVEQTQICPFGINDTIDLNYIAATSDSNGI
jgi:hypothetical protein